MIVFLTEPVLISLLGKRFIYVLIPLDNFIADPISYSSIYCGIIAEFVKLSLLNDTSTRPSFFLVLRAIIEIAGRAAAAIALIRQPRGSFQD